MQGKGAVRVPMQSEVERVMERTIEASGMGLLSWRYCGSISRVSFVSFYRKRPMEPGTQLCLPA